MFKNHIIFHFQFDLAIKKALKLKQSNKKSTNYFF